MSTNKKLVVSLYRILYRNNKPLALNIKPNIKDGSLNNQDIAPLLDLCKYMNYKDIHLAKLMVYKDHYPNIIPLS